MRALAPRPPVRILSLSIALAVPCMACAGEDDDGAPYVYEDALEAGAPMIEARLGHTATTLPDGRVLVVGGTLGSPGTLDIEAYVAEADLWDPATGSFERGSPLAVPRASHSATLLSDGRVVVMGGSTDMGLPGPAFAVEVWDPSSESFSTVAELEANFLFHCAVATADGAVLAIDDCEPGACTARRIDPDSGAVTELGGLPTYRYALDVDCVALPDGRVLFGGGTSEVEGEQVPAAALEIYDPEAASFSVVDAPGAAFGHDARLVALGGGEVLIVGDAANYASGGTLGLVYSASSGQVREVSGDGTNRTDHRAVRLADGRVLISGGRVAGSPDLDFAEGLDLYDPSTDTITSLGIPMGPRTGHAMAGLLEGPVLILGGQDASDRLASVERFF